MRASIHLPSLSKNAFFLLRAQPLTWQHLGEALECIGREGGKPVLTELVSR